ncbi:hypothetical protein Tco_0316419 [Tanacetum coccineum]
MTHQEEGRNRNDEIQARRDVDKLKDILSQRRAGTTQVEELVKVINPVVLTHSPEFMDLDIEPILCYKTVLRQETWIDSRLLSKDHHHSFVNSSLINSNGNADQLEVQASVMENPEQKPEKLFKELDRFEDSTPMLKLPAEISVSHQNIQIIDLEACSSEAANLDTTRIFRRLESIKSDLGKASTMATTTTTNSAADNLKTNEKEWKRTLACKLFEKRCSLEGGGEGMDFLWEAFEEDDNTNKISRSSKKETNLKNNKAKTEFKYFDDGVSEDGDEFMGNGQLCCLKALKISTGKMNLGKGKPNLVKISKALKGFGWSKNENDHRYETNARCNEYRFPWEQRPQSLIVPTTDSRGNNVDKYCNHQAIPLEYMYLGAYDQVLHQVLNTYGDIGTIEGQDSYNNVKIQDIEEQGYDLTHYLRLKMHLQIRRVHGRWEDDEEFLDFEIVFHDHHHASLINSNGNADQLEVQASVMENPEQKPEKLFEELDRFEDSTPMLKLPAEISVSHQNIQIVDLEACSSEAANLDTTRIFRRLESIKSDLRKASTMATTTTTNSAADNLKTNEKEWKRTLACKLFEKRCSLEGGGEGMDSLWEAFEEDDNTNKISRSSKKKTNLKNNKAKTEFKYFDDGVSEDGDEFMGNGQLCCLKALKMSTGKMNLGKGKPNLVKISKALKGFGWSKNENDHRYETNARCNEYRFPWEQRPQSPIAPTTDSRGNNVDKYCNHQAIPLEYMHLGAYDQVLHRVLNTYGDIGTIEGQGSL